MLTWAHQVLLCALTPPSGGFPHPQSSYIHKQAMLRIRIWFLGFPFIPLIKSRLQIQVVQKNPGSDPKFENKPATDPSLEKNPDPHTKKIERKNRFADLNVDPFGSANSSCSWWLEPVRFTQIRIWIRP